MAVVQVGTDHVVAGIIHVQIVRDDTVSDPQQAFAAQINAPGVTMKTLALNNAAKLDIPVHSGQIAGTVHVEVDDFRVLPAGATAQNATAISCSIVFKLLEFFTITLGSVPVTAALR